MFQLKSRSTHSINSDHVQPKLISVSDEFSTNLLEKYPDLNLSVESLESIDSSERRSSTVSDVTDHSNLGVLSVECLHDPSMVANAKPSREFFTNNNESIEMDNERNFSAGTEFVDRFNSTVKHYKENVYVLNLANVIHLLNYTYSRENKLDENLFPYLHGLTNSRQRIFFNKEFKNLSDNSFNIEDYKKYDTYENPILNQFHIMFLNTEDEEHQLINSIDYNDVFHGFKVLNSYKITRDGKLNNRNYKSQVQIYSTFCNFLVYSNSCDFSTNLAKALMLSKLTNSNQTIYVANFDHSCWNYIPKKYLCDYNFQQLRSLPINSVDNRVFNCKLLKWEQNLIWKFNSMRWLNENICLGNLIDYNYLSNVEHDFKLIINCNEYARIPKSIENCIEFPSSGYIHFQYLSYDDVINYLTLLKTIQSMVERNEQIFIFSFDGFTGLTLLTLSICLMLNKSYLSSEDLILDIYGSDNYLKFYYFKNDLNFLRRMEGFIHASKNVNIDDSFNLVDCKPVSYSNRTSKDWFNFDRENNMPCKIIKSLYLGSGAHANSKTVLNCMKFEKIVSIGEQPNWLTLNHPIYGYENEQGDMVEIYEIKASYPDLPHLKLVIFIKNLKDDGKDSILHLLINCPQYIQAKILANPNQSGKIFYHCKIGVSRSASLVIASLMKYQKMSLIHSYMIVRTNRFNIIIQPNLRIFYDLYLFEEYLNNRRSIQRQFTWYTLCDEIYKLNKNYID